MTKTAWFIAIGLLLLPAAVAHGAPGVRSIDTRVVLDNTEFGDYSGEGGLPPPFVAEAVDLLAVDVREATLANGIAGIWLRIISQTDIPDADHRIDVSFTAGGEHAFTLTSSDHLLWQGDFDVVLPGVPVGDGHPIAVDAFLSYERLGVGPGTVLENVVVRSFAGDTEGDVMPGGWSTVLVAVPLLDDGSVVQPYTLQGPAPLLVLEGPTRLDLGNAESLSLELLADAAGLDQFVQVSVEGLDAAVSPASMILNDETRTLTVAGQPGQGAVVITSDLGGYVRHPIEIVAAPIANDTLEPVDEGPEPVESTPLPILIPLAAIALARRFA